MAACSGEEGAPGATGANGPAGPTGSGGPTGPTGPAGDSGTPGATGPSGEGGTPAPSKGTIAGTVKDDKGAAVEGVDIATDPASVAAKSDATGGFKLADVTVGSYTVVATKADYTTFKLANVGVAGSATTNVSLVISVDPKATGTITGKVVNTKATPDAIADVTVSVQGQSITAKTDATGAFKLDKVPPGPVFLSAVPTGTTYLEGETRIAVTVAPKAETKNVQIVLSARPPDTAKFKGGDNCKMCHAAYMTALSGAAHNRSITPGLSHMLPEAKATFWPAVNGITDTKVDALSSDDGTTTVRVYLCQNVSGQYAMKFGGSNASCTDGAPLVPVVGTYGGEGDLCPVDPADPGKGTRPNLGKFKQRFFAKLADVKNAAGWAYATQADKDRDYLILPVQVTQSGDASPKLGGYHGTDWDKQSRTFSRKCSGCHATGLEIGLDASNFTTSFNYKDLNITCEHCHGPGSEHADKGGGKANNIINPRYTTAAVARDVCGKCHSGDDGASKDPDGVFGYAWNKANAAKLGGGNFVPGVYKLGDYIKGFMVTEANGGAFNAWPDGQHGLAHRQQYAMLSFSKHANNPNQKLVCADCHDVHSTYQGPAKAVRMAGADTFEFATPKMNDNVLCLGCHAAMDDGPFAKLGESNVAGIHVAAGGAVTKNGTAMTFKPEETLAAKKAVAAAVTAHMLDKAAMGNAAYTPLDDKMPVGRCTSCHMPKVAKSGSYTTGLDFQGKTALVEGDQGSHVFDIIWPWQSAMLKKATGGADTDIMPNSCGKCHAGARLSGD